MSRPSYNILISSIEAYGHINALCGFGELLLRHGHTVTFAHRRKYQKLAEKHGFKFIPIEEEATDSSFEEMFLEWIDKNMDKFRREPMERYKNYTEEEKATAAFGIDQCLKLNDSFAPILANNTFDAIIQDGLDVLNCIYNATIPVISSLSAAPLVLYDKGPPEFSGLSVNSDRELWKEFKKYITDANSKMIEKMDALLLTLGRPARSTPFEWIPPPKTIGFYHYPDDLDFHEFAPIKPNWHRIDCYVRSPDEGEFEIPETLKDKPGKLIYFSLGSTASNDLVIMKKALSALSRCGHRVIVSVGRRGDQLPLSDNMWGQEYVNQVAIIEKVDLVITHGGNNTLMESLYYGKPMIVIPWFFDQLDNAQRIVDKKIGFRVNPWEFDENYLLDCIEKIFNDTELQKRVHSISKNMRNSDSGAKAVKMIEDLIDLHKKS